MSGARLEPELPKAPALCTPPHSPARPILLPMPIGEMQIFFFKKTSKKLGITPTGEKKIPLSKYEGKHHLKGCDETGLIFTGDSPVKSPQKNNLQHIEHKLTLMLGNLKERTDMDFGFFKSSSDVSNSHYEATRVKLYECIALFKKGYYLSLNKEAFIEKYNDLIKDSFIYNPFRLNSFYASESFDSAEYTKACASVDYRSSITIEDFEGLILAGQKRKRDENFKFLVPRSVALKRDQNDSPTAKKQLTL